MLSGVCLVGAPGRVPSSPPANPPTADAALGPPTHRGGRGGLVCQKPEPPRSPRLRGVPLVLSGRCFRGCAWWARRGESLPRLPQIRPRLTPRSDHQPTAEDAEDWFVKNQNLRALRVSAVCLWSLADDAFGGVLGGRAGESPFLASRKSAHG